MTVVIPAPSGLPASAIANGHLDTNTKGVDKSATLPAPMTHDSNTNGETKPAAEVPFTGMIEWEDKNYVDECALLTQLKTAPSGTDVYATRAWLLAEGGTLPRKPESARFRTEVPVKWEDVKVVYAEGEYEVRVCVPEANGVCGPKRAAVIMYHGGGWIHGDAAGDHDIAVHLASELRATIFNVSYRLAPENPFPTSHNDCYDVVSWVIDHAEEYGVDTSRIGLWGCSAGGNLAAGVALRDALEHPISRIRHVNLYVPVTCHPDLYPPPLKQKLAQIPASDRALIQDFFKIWTMFTPTLPISQFASPLAAPHIPSSHPSVHIAVGGRDYLRDEGIAYALRLRDAGVDCALDVVPGVPHGVTLAPKARVAKQFWRDQIRALETGLNAKW